MNISFVSIFAAVASSYILSCHSEALKFVPPSISRAISAKAAFCPADKLCSSCIGNSACNSNFKLGGAYTRSQFSAYCAFSRSSASSSSDSGTAYPLLLVAASSFAKSPRAICTSVKRCRNDILPATPCPISPISRSYSSIRLSNGKDGLNAICLSGFTREITYFRISGGTVSNIVCTGMFVPRDEDIEAILAFVPPSSFVFNRICSKGIGYGVS